MVKLAIPNLNSINTKGACNTGTLNFVVFSVVTILGNQVSQQNKLLQELILVAFVQLTCELMISSLF